MIIPIKLTLSMKNQTIKLILADLIFDNKRRRSYENHSVIVVFDFVSTDLSFSRINQEKTLASTTVYLIFHDGSVNTVFSAKGNIRFNIIIYFIFFNMS